MTWFTDYRQAWIAEMIDIYGFINREHIIKKFKVSVPQASADLSVFRRNNPDKISYDLTAKTYVPTKAATEETDHND